MLIAAWHCACNGAAPASLLRYGLRHRSNSGFAGTETAEAPYASTGMITHDGNYSIKFRGNNKEAGRLKRPASLFVLWLYFILPV